MQKCCGELVHLPQLLGKWNLNPWQFGILLGAESLQYLGSILYILVFHAAGWNC